VADHPAQTASNLHGRSTSNRTHGHGEAQDAAGPADERAPTRFSLIRAAARGVVGEGFEPSWAVPTDLQITVKWQ
jgi:hypothetical protein